MKRQLFPDFHAFTALVFKKKHSYSIHMHNQPISASPYRRIGVLGGMGPLATVDFLHKLVDSTAASRDQEHVPMVVEFCPQIPDRAQALLGLGPTPLDGLILAAQALERSGAQGVVMPCNTAHAWYESIAASLTIPMLHIVDEALKEALKTADSGSIGLLATSGTLHCEIYQSRSADVQWIIPTPDEQDNWVMAGIGDIKARRLAKGSERLQLAARALMARGAKVIILGCTEIPLALHQSDFAIPLIDSSLTLARASVAWAGGPLIARASAAPLAVAA
jgi:aspartate racemase